MRPWECDNAIVDAFRLLGYRGPLAVYFEPKDYTYHVVVPGRPNVLVLQGPSYRDHPTPEYFAERIRAAGAAVAARSLTAW